MKRKICLFLICSLFAFTPVSASVVYNFSFYDIALDDNTEIDDFSVIVEMDDYIATTGMMPLSPPITSSNGSMGFDVNYFGANSLGWFGFDDDGSAVIDDFHFAFIGASFVFNSDDNISSHIVSPGTWDGGLIGNRIQSPVGISGLATLTITENIVPEPATMMLFGIGLLGLAGVSRRKNK